MARTLKTVGAALRYGGQLLRGSDAPHLDAEALLAHVLQMQEPSWLHAHADTLLTDVQESYFLELLSSRQRGVPLAYLLGVQEFYGRDFVVSPAVLIPRPSTEALVEKALEVIGQLRAQKRRPLVVADVGCGSGCIAVTLALETTPAVVSQIVATDISAAALAVAHTNVRRHAATSRVLLRQGDLLTPLRGIGIDLIVSNPPYVPAEEVTAAYRSPTPTTRGLAFEPRLALDGGGSGQRFTTALRESGLPLVLEGTHGIVYCSVPHAANLPVRG